MRAEDDQFTTSMVQSVRSAYTHGVESTIRGRDALHHSQIKELNDLHRAKLDMARIAAERDKAATLETFGHRYGRDLDAHKLQVDEDATKQVQEAKRSAEGTVQDLVRARHEISFLEADLEGAKVRVAAGDTWRKRYDQQKGLTERLQSQLDTIQGDSKLAIQLLQETNEARIQELEATIAELRAPPEVVEPLPSNQKKGNRRR